MLSNCTLSGKFAPEPFLERCEVLGHQGTEIRQRAARIDEGEQDGFASEIQAVPDFLLVDQNGNPFRLSACNARRAA
jgi:hypothetical protein